MKHYLLLLLLVPGLAAAQTPTSFVLKGRLGATTYRAKPTYVYLRSEAMFDSAVVKKGHFELKGTVDEPTKGFLSMRRHGEDLSDYKALFFLEQGTLVFTSPDSLKNAHVGGTPLTDTWRALWTAKEPIVRQLNALEKELRAATPAQQQSPAWRQGLQARRAALVRERTRLDSAFVRAHPTSFISLTVLNPMSRDPKNAALVMALLPTLSPAVFTNPRAEEIRKTIRQNALGIKTEPKANTTLQVGQPAPNFTQATPDGRQVSLTDYRGKYVLVDFWASWCGPCRQENPNLTKAYNQYKAKNFDVLSVSIDEARDRAKWEKAIQDDQLPWTQVADLKGWRGQAATAYFITFIPQNFLVDPTGKIIALNLRGEALSETLARLVK
jgi:peroxiredoxin